MRAMIVSRRWVRGCVFHLPPVGASMPAGGILSPGWSGWLPPMSWIMATVIWTGTRARPSTCRWPPLMAAWYLSVSWTSVVVITVKFWSLGSTTPMSRHATRPKCLTLIPASALFPGTSSGRLTAFRAETGWGISTVFRWGPAAASWKMPADVSVSRWGWARHSISMTGISTWTVTRIPFPKMKYIAIRQPVTARHSLHGLTGISTNVGVPVMSGFTTITAAARREPAWASVTGIRVDMY